MWDVMSTTLGQDNYVKLYASHVLNKLGDMDRDERRQWLSELIDILGNLHTDPTNSLGIHSVDIAFHGDLVVAFTEPGEAMRLVEAGAIELTLKSGDAILVPTAPVVEQGTISHLRYLVKTRT
jgi:hypothetical protein